MRARDRKPSRSIKRNSQNLKKKLYLQRMRHQKRMNSGKRSKLWNREHEKRVTDLKEEYDAKIKVNDKIMLNVLRNFRASRKNPMVSLAYYAICPVDLFPERTLPVLRGKVISVYTGIYS